MAMKWCASGVLLLAFVFLAVSSLSSSNYCTCGGGYVCVNGTCVPGSVSGNICNVTEGLRGSIYNDFGITISDNCSLDSDQLGVIYNVLSGVPNILYNVSEVIVSNESGASITDHDKIMIPDIGVGSSGKDSIPDGIWQHADKFSIIFVRELNLNIRHEFIYKKPEFRMREYQLVSRAGPNPMNYIRSDYPDNFFPQHDYEFFPAISEAYFQDSELTFNLTFKRFKNGYKEPVNQFLFFADVYSLGLNKTRFYTLDEDGVIGEYNADIKRDFGGHINFLSFGKFRYRFTLDHYGNVMNISREPPVLPPPPKLCADGTPYGNCSAAKPLFCYYNGTLIKKCSICGCEEGKYCENESCVAKCSDGTPYGGCSQTKPYYCENGTLVKKCSVCGCYPFSFCNPQNDTCQYNQTFTNHPPAITQIGDRNVREGELIEFFVNAYDVDQDVLSYHVFGLPEGSIFNVSSRRFRWVPRYDQAGDYEIIFAVSDRKFNDSEKIIIHVINVNREPKSEIAYPSSNQKFYVKELIQFSSKGSGDPDKDPLNFTWDFGDGNKGRGMFVNHTYDDPGTYNITLGVSDGNLSSKVFIALDIKTTEEPILDGDRDGVEGSKDKCPYTPPLKRVNIYGCALPEYTKFRNNLTTDFSKVDLLNATNVTIGIPEMGVIEFKKNVMNLEDKNLDEYVEISYMGVEINTEKIPELNKSAVITLYNVTIEDPVILRDGVYCHECRVVRYSNGTFVFSVPHFTRYSLMAWASYSGYCGDGLCSIYETCYDCTDDCGGCRDIEITPTECEEYWMCSPWSECNELDLKTRECSDVNLCGTERNKPKETTECREEPFPSLSFFGIIVFVLTTIYIVLDRYKKRKELRKLSRYELHEIIRGYMYRGFTKPDIRKVLKSKGYTDKEISKLIREVEKEIF